VVLDEVGPRADAFEQHRRRHGLPARGHDDVRAREAVEADVHGRLDRAEEAPEGLLNLALRATLQAPLLVDEPQLDHVPAGLEPADEVRDRRVAARAAAEARDDDGDGQHVGLRALRPSGPHVGHAAGEHVEPGEVGLDLQRAGLAPLGQAPQAGHHGPSSRRLTGRATRIAARP
jgi:hypothetical protein